MRREFAAVALLLLSVALLLAACGGEDESLERIPAIVEQVEPAIVSVLVQTDEGGAQGSGVVWDGDEGLIITNCHVVQGARAVLVIFAGGERLEATVVAADRLTDLAVLSVDRDDLPEAEFARHLPVVGGLAVALGNPLGFQNTVTAGIVSGLHRSLPSGGQTPALIDLIQTDAPISPGNSGGALLDHEGKVIGINVAGAPMGNSLGFAIPSPTVISVVNQLLERGEARHAFLGIERSNLTPDVAQQFAISPGEGVAVISVIPGSPAEAEGLEPGDVILELDGEPMRVVEDLWAALRIREPGDDVDITLVRAGEELEVEVELADRPPELGFDLPLS